MYTHALLVTLAFVLPSCAFLVTEPNASQGWTSSGPNTVAWDRVETDPTTFTIVLTNTDRSVLPVNNQVLAENVDGTSASSISISGPDGGFPAGGSFRVNLVKSRAELNTIYAQSNEFTISGSGGPTSSVQTTTVTSTTQTTTTLLSSSTSASGTTTSPANPSPSQTNLAVRIRSYTLNPICSSVLVFAIISMLA